MDRRGFLGTLASLPIVGVMVPKNKEPEVTKEMIEKVLNHPLDDPVWQTIPCSGCIPKIVGVIPDEHGNPVQILRDSHGKYHEVIFKTEIL